MLVLLWGCSEASDPASHRGTVRGAAVHVPKKPYAELSSPLRSSSAAGPYHVDWLDIFASHACLARVCYCSFGMHSSNPDRHHSRV